jgi:hypothetical protein
MTSKFLSLVAGVAALGLVGAAANAAEPMQLTDAQMDGVTAGTLAIHLKKKFDTEVGFDFDIKRPKVKGEANVAESFADALAYGEVTAVEAYAVTETVQGVGSSATAAAVSGSFDKQHRRRW